MCVVITNQFSALDVLVSSVQTGSDLQSTSVVY